jgi:hypothetical protein
MSQQQIILEVIKICLALAAAFFTYFQFFREGRHKQRIQFDIHCRDLGIVKNERIVEIGCIAENKGNVEQKFDDIRVVVRGLDKSSPLHEMENHAPRLDFPEELSKASLISKKWQYYFVRPHVTQRFPLVVKLPQSISHILVRSTFRYQGSGDIHSAERAFGLEKITEQITLTDT